MSDLGAAILLAAKAHHGRTRRNGLPYILHPFRVMLRMKTEEEMIVAVLHDVVEDTSVTLDELCAAGFSQPVTEAVRLLTKQHGGDYDKYLVAVSGNSLARRVKIADLEDNLNLDELPEVGDKDLLRVAKYHRALKMLRKACGSGW